MCFVLKSEARTELWQLCANDILITTSYAENFGNKKNSYANIEVP